MKTLQAMRDKLRKSYIGSDDQCAYLYDDAMLCLKSGSEITEDHLEAVKATNRMFIESNKKVELF